MYRYRRAADELHHTRMTHWIILIPMVICFIFSIQDRKLDIHK